MILAPAVPWLYFRSQIIFECCIEIGQPRRRLTSVFDLDKPGGYLRRVLGFRVLSPVYRRSIFSGSLIFRVIDQKNVLAVTNVAVEPSIYYSRFRQTVEGVLGKVIAWRVRCPGRRRLR